MALWGELSRLELDLMDQLRDANSIWSDSTRDIWKFPKNGRSPIAGWWKFHGKSEFTMDVLWVPFFQDTSTSRSLIQSPRDAASYCHMNWEVGNHHDRLKTPSELTKDCRRSNEKFHVGGKKKNNHHDSRSSWINHGKYTRYHHLPVSEVQSNAHRAPFCSWVS